VTTARLSPDGKSVVTGSQSGVANVFDTATGALQWPLRSHTGKIYTASWSPAGDRVLTSSADGTARIWDPTKGKAVAGFLRHDHTAEILYAAWGSDGRRVITAGGDRRAIVWQLPDPPAEGELPRPARDDIKLAHEDAVVVAAFVADRWIVTAGNDNLARVWDLHGRPVATFEHAEDVSSIAVSPDGTTLVCGCRDGTAVVWDLERNIARDERDLASPIHTLAVSRDGTVAAGTDDSRVTVWREALPRMLRGHRGRVFAAAFSPDGTELVTAGEDAEALVWNAADLAAAPRAVPLGEVPKRAVAFGPYRTTFAIGDDAGVLRIVSAHGTLATTSPIGAPLAALAFSPDGETIAGGTADGRVLVWNVRAEPIGQPFSTGFPVRALGFSGGTLVVAGARVVVLRFIGDKLVPEPPFEGATGEVAALAISRDRDAPLVFTGGDDGVVRVWDGRRRKLLATRQAQGEAIESLALSPDEQLLWTGTTDGIARAWTVGTLRDTRNLDAFVRDNVPWELGEDDVVRRVEN
jgi:WD40 repeat protein